MSETVEKPDESEPLTDRQIAYLAYFKDPDFVERTVIPQELAFILGWKISSVSNAVRRERLPAYDMDISGRQCGWNRSTLLITGVVVPEHPANLPTPEASDAEV